MIGFTAMNIWETHKLERGICSICTIGALRIWIELKDMEYRIAFEYLSEETELGGWAVAGEDCAPTEGIIWNRIVIHDDSQTVQLVPALPDRPIVVSPEFPIKIIPGEEVLFYLSIPMWVRIFCGDKKQNLLLTVPSTVLSNTWFGDVTTGELCYSLKTRARLHLDLSEQNPLRSVCPVLVSNLGLEQLDFQKLCVHVEHLRLYRGTTHFRTNGVNIDYLSGDQPGTVNFSKNPPSDGEDFALISEERTPAEQNILRRSFSFIKSITISD
jgi:hypothetical protein